MRQVKVAIATVVLGLSACASTETWRQNTFIGMKGGKEVYRFSTITGGLWRESKLNSNISYRAGQICPHSYEELSRKYVGANNLAMNGTVVTQLQYVVTIACPPLPTND